MPMAAEPDMPAVIPLEPKSEGSRLRRRSPPFGLKLRKLPKLVCFAQHGAVMGANRRMDERRDFIDWACSEESELISAHNRCALILDRVQVLSLKRKEG